MMTPGCSFVDEPLPVLRPLRELRHARRRTAAALSAFVLVGLSAFMVVPMWLLLTRSACACQSRAHQAQQAVIHLQGAIERFMLEKRDRCPKQWEDLRTAGILRTTNVLDPTDPWKHPYVFVCRDEHTPVVCSFGHEVELKGGLCSDELQ